jgi:hypothetical protein
LSPVAQFPSLPPLDVPQESAVALRHGTTVQVLPLAAWHGPESAGGDLQVCSNGHPLFGVLFELQRVPVLMFPRKQKPTVVNGSSQFEICPLLKASIADMQSTVLPFTEAVVSPAEHAVLQAAKVSEMLVPAQVALPSVAAQFKAAAISCRASCFVDVPWTGTHRPSVAESALLMLLAPAELIFSPHTTMQLGTPLVVTVERTALVTFG